MFPRFSPLVLVVTGLAWQALAPLTAAQGESLADVVERSEQAVVKIVVDGDGASFGENRCAALADGYAAWLRDGQAQDAVLAGRRGLIAAWIDDLRPHLRRGSA